MRELLHPSIESPRVPPVQPGQTLKSRIQVVISWVGVKPAGRDRPRHEDARFDSDLWVRWMGTSSVYSKNRLNCSTSSRGVR
jgi:hypothetical protein